MAEKNQYWNQLISKGLNYLQEQNNDDAVAVLKKQPLTLSIAIMTAGAGEQTTGRCFSILSKAIIGIWEIR